MMTMKIVNKDNVMDNSTKLGLVAVLRRAETIGVKKKIELRFTGKGEVEQYYRALRHLAKKSGRTSIIIKKKTKELKVSVWREKKRAYTKPQPQPQTTEAAS